MSDPGVAPYLAVLSLTRCERDLIASGDWEGVVTIGSERAKIVATLPARAPEAAREVVAEALAQMQTNLAFVTSTQGPLKHQFELEIEMWQLEIARMERQLGDKKGDR